MKNDQWSRYSALQCVAHSYKGEFRLFSARFGDTLWNTPRRPRISTRTPPGRDPGPTLLQTFTYVGVAVLLQGLGAGAGGASSLGTAGAFKAACTLSWTPNASGGPVPMESRNPPTVDGVAVWCCSHHADDQGFPRDTTGSLHTCVELHGASHWYPFNGARCAPERGHPFIRLCDSFGRTLWLTNGCGLTGHKLWERCEVLTPPGSLNAYMFGRGHVARDVNRAMMLELFVKEVGAEAASAFYLWT